MRSFQQDWIVKVHEPLWEDKERGKRQSDISVCNRVKEKKIVTDTILSVKTNLKAMHQSLFMIQKVQKVWTLKLWFATPMTHTVGTKPTLPERTQMPVGQMPTMTRALSTIAASKKTHTPNERGNKKAGKTLSQMRVGTLTVGLDMLTKREKEKVEKAKATLIRLMGRNKRLIT